MKIIITIGFLAFSCLMSAQISSKPITEISQQTKINGILIDVRTAEEFEAGNIAGAINIDWYSEQFLEQFKAISKSDTLYLYCKKGGRSAKASELLFKEGYTHVVNLLGGYDAYVEKKQE